MFESYLDRWRLTADGDAITTHSSHLLPVLWNSRPAMLKIANDEAERAGGAVMQWWDGIGAAKVYACDADAVVLERAEGSRSLLAMAMNGEDDAASRIICDTVARLHAPRNKPLPDLIPLSRWFRELAPTARTYGDTLVDCSVIAEALLADPRDNVVLHGDIHHRNILDFQELRSTAGWRSIPRGSMASAASTTPTPSQTRTFRQSRHPSVCKGSCRSCLRKPASGQDACCGG
jgi:streptomycin 6-kinase